MRRDEQHRPHSLPQAAGEARKCARSQRRLLQSQHEQPAEMADKCTRLQSLRGRAVLPTPAQRCAGQPHGPGFQHSTRDRTALCLCSFALHNSPVGAVHLVAVGLSLQRLVDPRPVVILPRELLRGSRKRAGAGAGEQRWGAGCEAPPGSTQQVLHSRPGPQPPTPVGPLACAQPRHGAIQLAGPRPITRIPAQQGPSSSPPQLAGSQQRPAPPPHPAAEPGHGTSTRAAKGSGPRSACQQGGECTL